MRRYTPGSASPRDYDVISVKLKSGLAIIFRPIDADGIAIELTRNDEPICNPTNYPHDQLRQFLAAFDLQCHIVKMRVSAPNVLLGIELEDGFALTFTRVETGFYASVIEQESALGHPTFLAVERMERIIKALNELIGAPTESDESDGSDESNMPSGPHRTWN